MNYINFTIGDSKSLNSCKKSSMNIQEWNDKKVQKLRNAGKEYVNKRGKGILIPSKTLPSSTRGCQSNCTREGCKSLSLGNVHKHFSSFYELNYNEQTLFLLRFIKIREIKRRRSGKTDDAARKLVGFDYIIDNKPVCLKTFKNTFGITDKRVRVLQGKLKEGEIAPKDKRGCHLNRPHAILYTDIQEIIMHIQSFPKQESHYSRRLSAKQCLSMDLSLKKMHRLFRLKHVNTTVSYSLYRKVFIKHFNLRFGVPRSDTCKLCDKFYGRLIMANTEDERTKIEQESNFHHIQADAAYKNIALDGKNENYVTLCVDLQQVLYTPMLTHSDVYYQRQYSSYNLGIHNITKNEAHMFLWHEIIAKRGSREIGSCILNYVQTTFPKLLPNQERKLILWSDRCVGQNNNKNILSLYMYLIRLGYFSEVHQKFMITGHSFLPCDRDFALIERRKKVRYAMVPKDWKKIISEAKLGKPFLITEMEQVNFKDLEVIQKTIMKTCSKFQITKYVWYKLSRDDPTSLYARTSHNLLRPWTIFKLFTDPSPSILSSIINLPPLYLTFLPIQKEKKSDLIKMAEYLHSEENKQFYRTLPSY